MGKSIESIQNYFKKYEVTLIKSIGGNAANNIGLAYGKYKNSDAFIKCFLLNPFSESFVDLWEDITQEEAVFKVNNYNLLHA
jgi:hypothetical protein